MNGKRLALAEVFEACKDWLEDYHQVWYVLPTGSCLAALETAAILRDLEPGDEFILTSFGYPSIVNAFARTGAVRVFVDIDPKTMNIAPDAVESAITYQQWSSSPFSLHTFAFYNSWDQFGQFFEGDRHTTSGSNELVRLPMFHGHTLVEYVVDWISSFLVLIDEDARRIVSQLRIINNFAQLTDFGPAV